MWLFVFGSDIQQLQLDDNRNSKDTCSTCTVTTWKTALLSSRSTSTTVIKHSTRKTHTPRRVGCKRELPTMFTSVSAVAGGPPVFIHRETTKYQQHKMLGFVFLCYGCWPTRRPKYKIEVTVQSVLIYIRNFSLVFLSSRTLSRPGTDGT